MPPTLVISEIAAGQAPPTSTLEIGDRLELHAVIDPPVDGIATWGRQGEAILLGDASPAPETIEDMDVAVHAHDVGNATLVCSFELPNGEFVEARHEFTVIGVTHGEPGLLGPITGANHPDSSHEHDTPFDLANRLHTGWLTIHSSCRGRISLWVISENDDPAFTPEAGRRYDADGFVFQGVTYKIDGSTHATIFVDGDNVHVHTCFGGVAWATNKRAPYPVAGDAFGTHKAPPAGEPARLVE